MVACFKRGTIRRARLTLSDLLLRIAQNNKAAR